jgi:hypothetical protein
MADEKPLDESTIIQHSQEWLNEHGHPSYSYLKELAEQYNVKYDRSTTVRELVEKIRLFMNIGPESP